MTKPKAPASRSAKKLTVKKSTIKDLSVTKGKGGKVRGGDPAAGQSVRTYCVAGCASGNAPC